MILAILGSRSATDQLYPIILRHIPAHATAFVTGGAPGVDQMAAAIADTVGIPVRVIPPDYARYGRRAPLVRNREITAAADEVLAFWDGVSNGTAQAIATAIEQGKPVRIIPIPPDARRASP